MQRYESISPIPLIDLLKSNKRFQALSTEINQLNFPEINDAEFYIRKDGLIINSEGWFHPEGKLLGEVLYAPDSNGNKRIFGQPFRKVTLAPGTYEPIPYEKRRANLVQLDPSLDQFRINPYFARYKQIYNRSEFVAYLSSSDVMIKLLSDPNIDTSGLEKDLENAEEILGVDFSQFNLGLTGAPLLGNLENLHDVDVVFRGSIDQNIYLARRMRDYLKDHPERRLMEGGKGWNIRYFNDRNSLMCSFFGYQNPKDAPLREIEMEVIDEDSSIEGVVNNDMHSIYTPSVLGIGDVKVKVSGKDVGGKFGIGDRMPLIIYHTASRGEFFNNDHVQASGALVNVKTPNAEYKAICVIDREGARNLTPSWKGYYQD